MSSYEHPSILNMLAGCMCIHVYQYTYLRAEEFSDGGAKDFPSVSRSGERSLA